VNAEARLPTPINIAPTNRKDYRCAIMEFLLWALAAIAVVYLVLDSRLRGLFESAEHKTIAWRNFAPRCFVFDWLCLRNCFGSCGSARDQ
jgi:hypothetical protein